MRGCGFSSDEDFGGGTFHSLRDRCQYSGCCLWGDQAGVNNMRTSRLILQNILALLSRPL